MQIPNENRDFALIQDVLAEKAHNSQEERLTRQIIEGAPGHFSRRSGGNKKHISDNARKLKRKQQKRARKKSRA